MITRWLISSTRPVLAPLGASVLFRHLYFFAHLALLGIGAWVIAAIARGTFDTPLWQPILLLVALALGKAVFNYVEHFLGHLVAFKALELLRVRLYHDLIPLATDQRRTSGDLLTRATKDIDRIEVFFAHTLAPALTAVTIPLLTVLCAIPFVGWPIALVAALGLLMSVVVVPLIGARAGIRGARLVNKARADIAQHVTDSLQGMQEVTGYGRTQERLEETSALDATLDSAQAPRGRWAALRDAAATATSISTILVIALVGLSSDVDATAVIVFAAVTWGLFDITAGVREFSGSLAASFAAAERVHDIATAAPVVPELVTPRALPEGPLGVELQDVTYSYPTVGEVRPRALSDVHLTIPASSHICLVGASGSGKSTVLSMIARHADPDAGTVKLTGGDKAIALPEVGLDDLRSRVLLVEQSAVLFRGTVAENLRLANPEASDEELWEALRVAALDEAIRDRDGLETDIGEGGKQLSGGQRQRLALARAVLRRSSVLLLDEYTAHLDDATAAQVRANLREALPEVTIVESTHSPASLDDADYIYLLDNGEVRAEGTLDEIAQQPAWKQLMERQASR
ncbi:thiol reductant ABC exporter subunit CydC [Corynebacterium camporealensis]|uniref:Cysteine export CydDC family ABC transporter permease subunit/ATP-binding protein CydC n=1 Tax=Corynebacterium camporealensis TaxID=161896 RepID=A0A0F6TC41_9CORY|nr:thiol reductant ABC exporter subunit CydC [Corynebacterium camporealensis]AKE40046.1 cysteine export CydDC family ABC transporter permease subunit/ATP-binding protein CydC [Corynebacterium camporealensis]